MKKIFVVEDDEDIRFVMESILESEGYRINSSENASNFLCKLKCFNPDLILLDIKLPDGDGRELCKLVKNDPSINHIPVILISANTLIKDISKEVKADGYIQKPFDIRELLSTLLEYGSPQALQKS